MVVVRTDLVVEVVVEVRSVLRMMVLDVEVDVDKKISVDVPTVYEVLSTDCSNDTMLVVVVLIVSVFVPGMTNREQAEDSFVAGIPSSPLGAAGNNCLL